MEIYDFFKSHGTKIEGDATDFTGVTGCCLYGFKESVNRSRDDLRDKVLIPSPHEGIIPSDLWLKCRKKLMANPAYQPARKSTQTWLAGKVKCGRCGFALMSIGKSAKRYMRCRKRAESNACEGCGTIRTHELEQLIYESMVEKL
jgi:hypothetical protein